MIFYINSLPNVYSVAMVNAYTNVEHHVDIA